MSNQIVTSGTISGITLSAGDSLTVNSGGSAVSILVDGGQDVNFGDASATTVEQGGILTISGGEANDTTVSSGGEVTAGSDSIASGTTVLNGGTFAALAGSNPTNLTVSSGGIGFINASAFAVGIQVDSGGIVVISPTNSLTVVDGVTVNSGGYAVILPGPGTVQAVTGSGAVVSTGVALIGPNGGITTYGQSATNLALGSGTMELVLPGGSAQGGTVNSGASQQIFSAGSASGVVLSQSFQTVNSGASASATIVDGGAVEYVYSGGSVAASIINNGGFVMVDSGGSGTAIIVNNGGIDVVDGAVSGTTVNSGGEENVVFSGFSVDTTINAGGALYAFGTAIATQINAGSYEVVEGEAVNPIVTSGGLLLDGYPIQNTNPPSTGVVSGAIVSSGGVEVIFAGSIDSGTTVESGGTYIALPGASVTGPTANAGAVIVSSGIVLFEPTASVSLIGTIANGLTLTSGVSDYVLSNSVESGTAISNYGYSEVGSGGIATDSTIEGGGTLSFAPGGLATGTIAFAGSAGTLDIQGPTLSGVTVMNFAPGDLIEFDAVTGKTSTATLLAGNALQVTNGTVTVDLQLDPSQNFSSSTFQVDATNRGAAVTISQSSTTASPTSPPSDDSVVPVDIPLYVLPFNDGYKIGINVSLDGGATYRMYEFDTGGTGFYTSYNPTIAGNFTVANPTPTMNTYTSGNNYVAQVVSTNVTFQTTTGQTVSVNNADVGLITAAQDPGDFTTQEWNTALTGTPSTPPLQGAFYGDFGLSLRPGLGIDAILPQISGGLSNGYIITVGNYPFGVNGQIGSIQVGLTPADIASFTTVISMQGQNFLDPFPNSGQPTYDEAQATGTVTLSNGTTSFSAPVGFTFDTGTPTYRIYASQSDLAPFQDGSGDFLPTTTITNTALPASTSDSGWLFAFTQGTDTGFNEAVSTTTNSSPSVTTGLNPFFGYRIMFDLADGLMGFQAISCFAAGTHLLTPRGEVAVEALRTGDEVITVEGHARQIIWIGRRKVDCLRHPSPQDVLPVRIQAHAFGPGLPKRDLYLSPDHALFIDSALIPVKYLLNGSTITQVECPSVSYYHVELERHDVVLAEALAAETYLDTQSRTAFENAGQVVQAHPVFGFNATDCSRQWEAFGYAPLMVTGPIVERVRQKLRQVKAACPTARYATP